MTASPFPTARLTGLVIAFWLATATATSVREVSLDEMLARAELVFEGEVTHLEVKETPHHHRPFTQITFRVLDVIKGREELSTVTLDFLGGQIGDKRLQVSDMDYPELGEHGIYFVESLQRRQVHPLYGWSQGRFLTTVDEAGQLHIRTADGDPVVRLEFDSASEPTGLSRGIAKGVFTRGDALSKEAISLDDFKRRLRQQLDIIR
ncbi:MAG: hypothetical protein JXR29_11945 [Methylothermaceae bacterium]|nr:hypothetical protein [Methylothermaceae bacterium]